MFCVVLRNYLYTFFFRNKNVCIVRAIVTLQNRRNYAADFTWSPILTDRGTAFSIRPATGTVEAFQDLKCEVKFSVNC